ncbi:hypothetical protein FQA39_LY07941 [Lamprigera yunnana]|nr:hypothetical protein FQA39_LY07941 [Lamprigera yunnana]
MESMFQDISENRLIQRLVSLLQEENMIYFVQDCKHCSGQVKFYRFPIQSRSSLSQVKNYIGAFAMFGVTPGSLLVNSPVLAKDTSGTFSFPSYSVKVKHLRFKLIDTTQAQERSDRWAAVFIPYREPHDANHYTTKLKDLTFAELVSMPAAVSGLCLKQLVINYRMRDLTDYCSRPRELAEEIGVVMIIWDCGNRDNFTKEPKKYSIYRYSFVVTHRSYI